MKKFIFLATIILFNATVWGGEKIDKSLDVKPDGRVSIQAMRGNIVIKGWKKNQVKVTGELDDAAEGYTFETSGGRTVFEVKMPHMFWGSYSGKGSELEIMLPVQSELGYSGVNANVTADGISGGTDIHLVNGNAEVSGLKSNILIETVNGNINSNSLSGDIALHTTNGRIDDAGSEGELKLETVNGSLSTWSKATSVHCSNVNSNMNFKLEKIKEFKATTVSGSIDASIDTLDKNAVVMLTSVNGSLNLNLPKSVSAEFNIQANAGGHITNNLSDHKPIEEKYGLSKSLNFTLKDGSSEVKLMTVNGHIRLSQN